ncbi:uncharacterized protein LOC111256682 [Setaria italica]|uniref:uncharacterized protein LOC111256682 n=1 Tax=Setaria italica TaxID=4555 RepID=UPI0003509F9A|nr:uncharacterized protein LOC111256682 [Setaria italica]
MTGPKDDPETNSTKLDRILAQFSIINSCLDSHDRRIARTEKYQAGDATYEGAMEVPPDEARRNPGGGGGNGDGTDGHDGSFGGPYGGRAPRHHDGPERPRPPKLSFPKFDGESDPLPWLNQCNIFFRGHQTMEEEKVWMDSLHLQGTAAQWYFQMEREFGILSWARFAEFVNMRFGPPIRSNALGELKDLHRTGSVEEYERRFLALLCRYDNLMAQHQIDLFTSGLGQPLASDVELQRPSNLQMAMSLARAFELRSKEVARAISGTLRKGPHPHSVAAPSTPSSDPAMPNELPRPHFCRLSAEELAEKRASGQCYFCPEKFSKDHKCAGHGGVFRLAMGDKAGDVEINSDDIHISLHALHDIATDAMIRLHISIHGVQLTALVDYGFTHTFIHEDVARCLSLAITCRHGLRVKVANGKHLTNLGICASTLVCIQGEAFSVDGYVLALNGFDVVLGVTWLKTLGPITWSFNALTMAFQYQGCDLLWHGIGGGNVDLVALTATRDLMDALLLKYGSIFAEPRGLPPQLLQDHRIHLLPGSTPVAVCPYHYPQLLKDDIERQCEDMLGQGIIRASTSPFSSLVLLVCKHDGSWHFCMDYRELNALTVKDKFPISVVDELLDKLRGAKFFTKINLRNGYHQVRMHLDDIVKTVFRTHHGHFEFLVMPFGLTNASATFQALMNTVLKLFLCRFVLVFFDDILIYSSSWTEHLQHVEMVLQQLQEHNLFAKQSKCFFGETLVAYLGHIISAAGVSMDSAKVAAVEAWPRPCSLRALRGFLGLTDYYRKFIAGYGAVVGPLTMLLKGKAFRWSGATEDAFIALKQALTPAPVLHLPDFSKLFVVDCDASGAGFGAILHQGEGPVAFFSQAVAPITPSYQLMSVS